jgi:ankyrin repeat protein
MPCIPARLAPAELPALLEEAEGDGDAVARGVGLEDWSALVAQVERRATLTSADPARVRGRLAHDPAAATEPLRGWCDHSHATSLAFMAMLRFDARRLHVSHDLSQTGEVARILLAAGAPVDGDPDDRESPLITAASYGDPDVAQALIDGGADVDRLSAPDSGGVAGGNALIHAGVFGFPAVVDVLAAAGARPRTLTEAAATGDISAWPLDQATETSKLFALIMAADMERLEVIDALLDAGAPIDAEDPEWGRRALRLASENGRTASVAHLLARGADPAFLAAPGE